MIYKNGINNYYHPDTHRVNTLFSLYQTPEYKKALNRENMPEFPFVSSLEFTNHCNLDCLFCARAVMTRPKGYMQKSLFEKIITEYRKHKTYIKINGYGENLLHPNATEFIQEIKKENGLYFTSNCTGLTDQVIDSLISNRVDVLQISFQGLTKESYEEQRRKSRYDLIVNNIKKLILKRGREPFPFIHLSTTILDESDEEIDNFIKWGFELNVDSVGIGRTDYDRVIEDMIKDEKRKQEIQLMKKRQSLQKVSDHTYLYRYIDVNWDGVVVSSFFDFNEFVPVGDLNNQSMHEIWNHSEVLNSLRVLEKNHLLNQMKVFDTYYHAWSLGAASYNTINK